MAEQYIKAEIVRPKRDLADNVGTFVGAIFGLALRVLFVWWALAVWFPEWGITYWQAVLPVYAIRMLVGNHTLVGRQLTK